MVLTEPKLNRLLPERSPNPPAPGPLAAARPRLPPDAKATKRPRAAGHGTRVAESRQRGCL